MIQYELDFDICKRRHKGNRLSKKANAKIAPRKTSIRETILSFIRSQGDRGATLHEVVAATGFAINTASARMTELRHERKKQVIERGERNGAGVMVAI